MGLDIPQRLWLKQKDFFDDVAPGVSLVHTHERGRERDEDEMKDKKSR
jgi:hypothetical protein